MNTEENDGANKAKNEGENELTTLFEQKGEEESSRKMSRFAKLLSQRNELKTQLSQLHQDKETYRNLVQTFFEEGQPAEKESAALSSALLPQSVEVASLPGANETATTDFEAVQFYKHYPQADKMRDKIAAVQAEMPGLSLEYAYRIVHPEAFFQEKFRQHALELNTASPQGISAPTESRSLQSFSSDELEEKAYQLWQQHRISL